MVNCFGLATLSLESFSIPRHVLGMLVHRICVAPFNNVVSAREKAIRRSLVSRGVSCIPEQPVPYIGSPRFTYNQDLGPVPHLTILDSKRRALPNSSETSSKVQLKRFISWSRNNTPWTRHASVLFTREHVHTVRAETRDALCASVTIPQNARSATIGTVYLNRLWIKRR